MKVVDTRSKSQFIQSIKSAIKEKLPEPEAKDLITFTDEFFLSSFVGEFEGRRTEDIIGLLVSARKFIQHYDGKAAKVVVFDPNLEEHGWQSSHTTLMIMQHNMPFIVDSIRMTLANREIKTHTIQYASFNIERDSKGKLTSFKTQKHKASDASSGEGLVFIELDRHNDNASKEALKECISTVLDDVAITVTDYPAMQDKIHQIQKDIEVLKGLKKTIFEKEEITETLEFLEWLAKDHFAFLGFVDLEIKESTKMQAMLAVKGSELGLLKSHPEQIEAIDFTKLTTKTKNAILNKQLINFAKAPTKSTVHRPAYPDCIAIKRLNDKGEIIGEHCFYGLYTARAYRQSLNDIPILRAKAEYVIERSELNVNDYRGKELVQLLSVYPRDELFQIDKNMLFDNLMGTLFVQERRQSRLFMREDTFGRFVTCLVYVPRDIYNTVIRIKIQTILMDHFHGQDVEFNTYISESVLARTQITIKLDPEDKQSFNIKELEEKIIAVTQSWEDELETSLHESYGEEVANIYINKYRSAFSSSYREEFSSRRAAIDIEHIENVSNGQHLGMSFYRALDETDEFVHFKLFHAEQPVTLSDVMPIFENMGFRVIGEHPYECIDREGRTVWIHDFTLTASSQQIIDINKIRKNFESLFLKVWEGNAENDSFNRLVISAYMNWRQIAVLRSYARYMRQVRVSNSQRFIANTVVSNTDISHLLIELFESRFNPTLKTALSKTNCEKIEADFLSALDDVQNLSEDKILRLYLDLIKATMRTNYYQNNEDGEYRYDIAFKFHPRLIPNVPMPVPKYEIFIYSPRIEGVHLRGGKVARGGLRWSDRYEDYRTEVLGLVKAQQVKNAVIVPVGAKGGFVAKRLPKDREAFMKEGIACYQIFIRGLLSVTDNLVDGAVVKPVDVVCHDDDDFYLVVAADKGTATFSDIANEISLSKKHWLGDAFASGGSQGYDHKKMGITAKGAWVSVQRHFRELGHDIQTTPFTAIGIGDMAGDVFGNGMLLSPCTKLVAVFNHMHIFFDPDPDLAKSFKERQRLFELPRSTWDDYDKKLISEGGGVYSRNDKSIKLTSQMQEFLDTNEKQMPPNQLINLILKAKADLLWIGGIGTYFMGSSETHADVGDKANDALRITGKEINVKVIGEGGNLGMTQFSRIEFALNGGLLNTDFIDNSAGVDCSDNEVNIKILLNEILVNGDLTEKQRNKLLSDMTEGVSQLVLKNNYRQTQAISIAHRDALARMEEYRRLINSMEAAKKLHRKLEFLPTDDAITERKSLNQGLTRPELSVLISYVKGDLKETLINSTLPDEAHLSDEITKVFPKQITTKYRNELRNHRLRREIIATQVANDMVNHMGITFVERLKQSTGATPASISLAYIIARDVFDLEKWWLAIESLDHKVPSSLQLEMMSELMSLMRRACRWLIRNRRSELNVVENMERYREGIQKISKCLPEFLTGSSKVTFEDRFGELKEQGVPEDLASIVAGAGHLYAALGIIEAHQVGDGKLETVARIYYLLGNRLDLTWFGHQINSLTPLTHWQALAREAFREDLDWQQRALTVGLLNLKDESQTIEERVDLWMEQHSDLISRWKQMLTEFKASEDAEFSMYSVALRELLDLAQSTVHAVPK